VNKCACCDWLADDGITIPVPILLEGEESVVEFIDLPYSGVSVDRRSQARTNRGIAVHSLFTPLKEKSLTLAFVRCCIVPFKTPLASFHSKIAAPGLFCVTSSKLLLVISRQSKEDSIRWSHHEETRELPGERDNARNDTRCTQARKATHGPDGQHQDADRTLRGRVNQNDRGHGQMEKVRPWCGQPSDRVRLKNGTEQVIDSVNKAFASQATTLFL